MDLPWPFGPKVAIPSLHSPEGRQAQRMATFLLVFLIAVAAGGVGIIVYFAASAPPRVLLEEPFRFGSSMRIDIRSVAPTRPLSEFTATLEVVGGPELWNAQVTAYTGGARDPVVYLDSPRDSRLTAGDWFEVVRCPPTIGPGTHRLAFTLSRGGETMASVEYTVSC